MNIRDWFLLGSEYQRSKVNSSVDKMLILCRQALSEYFSLANSENIKELIKTGLESSDINQPLDVEFLEWLKTKGLPRLHDIDFSNLPDSDHFIAMIEYEEYVLKSEMDYSDRDEVRSCIISFMNNLSEHISSSREVSASIESTSNENDFYFYIHLDTAFTPASYYEEQLTERINYSGSAINAGPFLYGGNKKWKRLWSITNLFVPQYN